MAIQEDDTIVGQPAIDFEALGVKPVSDEDLYGLASMQEEGQPAQETEIDFEALGVKPVSDLELYGFETQPVVEEPRDNSWDTLRGLEVSMRQVPQLAYGVAGLVGETAEQLTGYGESLRDFGFKGYQDWAESMEPISKETDDVTVAWQRAKEGDVGALVDWAQYGIGYALGQLGESAAVAVLGGIAGGAAGAAGGPTAIPAAAGGAVVAAAGKQGFKALAQNLVEKAIANQATKIVTKQAQKEGVELTAEQLAKRASQEAIKREAGKQIGSNAAIFANAIGMQLGAIYGSAEEKAREEGRELTGVDLARIWGTGIATGGLEGVVDKFGLDLLKGKFAEALPAGRLAGAAVAAPIGLAGEAATEAVQTVGERFGAGRELLSDEAINEYINASALGGLGGGAIGGVGGFISGNPKENAAAKAKVSSETNKDIAPATAETVARQADAVIAETVQETPEQKVARLQEEAAAAAGIELEEEPVVGVEPPVTVTPPVEPTPEGAVAPVEPPEIVEKEEPPTPIPTPTEAVPVEKPTVAGFTTAQGSTYEVTPEGKTIRTKRSEGRGQGETYEPHSVLFVPEQTKLDIQSDMASGMGENSLRMGYTQDNRFVQVTDTAQIPEGITPQIAIVNRNSGQIVPNGIHNAQRNPEVGLGPIEKLYSPDGTSSTHIGNQITEIRPVAEAAPAVTPPAEVTPTPETPNLEPLRRVARAEQAPEDVLSLVDAGLVEVYKDQPVLTEAGIAQLPEAERPRLNPEARKIQIDTGSNEVVAEAISKNLRIGVDQVGTGVRLPAGWTLVEDIYVPPSAPEVRESRREPAPLTQQDREYLDAVERGDTETQQRIVDEAARRGGYQVLPLFHGTEASVINRFRKKLTGIWLAFDKKMATPSSGEYPTTVINAYADLGSNPITLTPEQVKEWQNSGKPKDWIRIFRERNRATAIIIGDYATVVFKPSQVKSADSVTRDNQGNIIPPSQRFQPTEEDIRYKRIEMPRPAGMETEAVATKLESLGFGRGGIVSVVNQPDASFEGRTIIRDGKVVGIELNAAALKDDTAVERVLNHEIAESANADGALNTLVAGLTPKERKEINDAITRLGYAEKARTAEEAARAVELLAEGWRGRRWFERAVARVEAWANKLGYKLTRRAAEYIAARNVSEINAEFKQAYNKFINVQGEAREGRAFVTPEENARFLELAKNPESNREELQKMVDAVAKQAGAIEPNDPSNIRAVITSEDTGAYHYGDAGTARDTILKRMDGRGTGHFGTGTYFLGKKEVGFGREGRPVVNIDLSGLNMAKPESLAMEFHDRLRIFNEEIRKKQKLKFKEPRFDGRRILSLIDIAIGRQISGNSEQKIREAMIRIERMFNQNQNDGFRTPSTYLMQELGFDGIDVRGTNADNTDYGSVVYPPLKGVAWYRAESAEPERIKRPLWLAQKKSLSRRYSKDDEPKRYYVFSQSGVADEGIARELTKTLEGSQVQWPKENTNDVSILTFPHGSQWAVVKNINQIKSANPVTYDDQGNVIPLSERFQQTTPDIRYSIRESRREDAIPTFSEVSPEAATITNMKESMAKVDTASEGKPNPENKPTYKISEIASVWMDQGGDTRQLQDMVVEYTNLTPANAKKVADAIAKQYDKQQQIAEAVLETETGVTLEGLQEGMEIPKDVDPKNKRTVLQRVIDATTGVRVKPVILQVPEKTALKEQIRLKARETREAKKAQQETADAVVEAIKALELRGPMRAKQAQALAKRAAKVIWTSEKSMENFMAYAERVMANTNYDADLREAKAAQKRAKELSKRDSIAAPQRFVLEAIGNVGINLLNDPREFSDVVNHYLRSFKPVVSEAYVVVPDAEMESYLSAAEDEVVSAKAEFDVEDNEKLAEKYGVSVNDLQRFLDAEDIMDALESYAKREAIEGILNEKSSGVKEALRGVDTTILRADQRKLIDSMKVIDVKSLDSAEKQAYIRIGNNIIFNNNQTNGAEFFVATAKGQQAARDLAKNTGAMTKNRAWANILPSLGSRKAKKLLKSWASELQSIADTFRNAFGKEAMTVFYEAMGMVDLDLGFTQAARTLEEIQEKMAKFYDKLDKKYKGAARAQDGILSEGIVAYLIQSVPAKGEADSLAQRRGLMQQNIVELRKSGDEDKIQMADRIQQLIQKLDGDTVDQMLSNLKREYPANYESLMWLKDDLFPQYKDFLKVSDENFNDQANNYNTPNYLPIIYSNATPALDLLQGKKKYYDNLSSSPKQSSYTIKRSDYTQLPMGSDGRTPKEIGLNLRKNAYNSLSDQITRAYTNPARQRIYSFLKTPQAEEALGGKANLDFFADRIERLMGSRERRGSFNEGFFGKAVDVIANLGRDIGTRIALAGSYQLIRQPADQVTVAVGATGRADLMAEHLAPRSIKNARPVLDLFSIGRRGDASSGYKYINQMEGAQSRLERYYTEGNWVKAKEAATRFADKFMTPLKVSDFTVAAATWMTFYRAYLAKNGIRFTNWEDAANLIKSDDTGHKRAAAYAENMTDIYQGSSDPTKMAVFAQKGKTGSENLLKAILVPFNSFGVQFRARVSSDLTEIFTKSGDWKGKAIAVKDLSATIGGTVMFGLAKRFVLPAITYGGVKILYSIFGVDVEEPDEEKKKEEFEQKWRQLQGDIISTMAVGGFGQMVESYTIDGMNYIKYMIDTANESESVLDDDGDIMSFNEYAKERAPFYRYRSFDNAFSLGILDIGMDQAKKSILNTKMVLNPEEMERFTPEEQRFLYVALISDWLYLGGFNDADFARMWDKGRRDMIKARKEEEKEIKAIRSGR